MLTSGTYKPSSYQGPVALPGTAPASLYQFTLSGMNWSDPNGAWSLYVFDDSPGDDGVIASGWSLNLATVVTVGPVNDVSVGLTSAPASVYTGASLTNTISITNFGPNSATGVMLTSPLPAGVSFVSAALSQGSLSGTNGGQVTCSLGSLPAGGVARVTIVVAPSVAGTLSNSVSVLANEEDLNPANNSAQTTTTVITFLPATLTGSVVSNQFHLTVTAQPNFTYVVQGSTNLTSWVSLGTNTNPTGTFNYIDKTTPAPQQRFYRTVRR